MNIRNIAKNLYFSVEKFVSLIGVSTDLPDIEKARKMLQAYSPDNGSGCYLEKKRNWDQSNSKCMLSIIVPVYNVEKYIEKCVLSILEQETDISYQLILVNDCTPDRSREIIEKFVNDSHVEIIDMPKNSGISAARNAGLERAGGEYIMFVDSDDSLCPGAIDKLMKCALKVDADIVAGEYYIVKNGKYTQAVKYRDERVNPRTSYYGMPWGKVFKRNIFDHLIFPEKYWLEDSILAQIVWPSCDNCYTVSSCVYNYLNNTTGRTNVAKKNPKVLDSLYITEHLLGEREKFGLVINDMDYEYFLHMVRLTGFRTKRLPVDIKKCIFVVQCELWNRYYNHCKTEKDLNVQKALKQRNFKRYLLL